VCGIAGGKDANKKHIQKSITTIMKKSRYGKLNTIVKYG